MSKYIDMLNREKREAVIRLYGEIGQDINGDIFAQELASLDGAADTVHLRINGPGGNVIQGLSIVSAIQSMKAYVVIHIDGIAASMCAVIAVCGDKVMMMDYAKLMIHDPFFSDGGKATGKARKALDSITDILRIILSRRGCDKDKIAKLMTEETWLSADEAKTINLIDEVVSSQRKGEFENLTTAEILSRIGNEYKPKKEGNMDLKKIAASLGLPDTATEAEVLKEIERRGTAHDGTLDALIARYLAFGEQIGTVTDKNKARLERLAKVDFDLFADTVLDTPQGDVKGKETLAKSEAAKANTAGVNRLSAAIAQFQQAAGTSQPAATARKWDWYQKNDSKALTRMEKESPDQFKALLDEYENSL